MIPSRPRATSGLRDQVISSVFWVAAMQYTGQIVSWAITLYVIRLLDPDDYGLMAKTTICIGFMLMVSELGLTVALIQKKDINRDQIAGVFGFVMVTGAAMAAALFVAAPVLADFFRDVRLIPIYRTVCLVFFMLPLYIVPQSLMIRRMEFQKTDIKATWADTGKAKRLLGWEPHVPLEEGLQKSVQWYLQNKEWASRIEIDLSK